MALPQLLLVLGAKGSRELLGTRFRAGNRPTVVSVLVHPTSSRGNAENEGSPRGHVNLQKMTRCCQQPVDGLTPASLQAAGGLRNQAAR